MEILKYRTVQLLILAIILALVAIPFDEAGYVFLSLRLLSFAILMYVFIKFTSVRKKQKAKKIN
jgi:hypothetical protein